MLDPVMTAVNSILDLQILSYSFHELAFCLQRPVIKVQDLHPVEQQDVTVPNFCYGAFTMTTPTN